MVGYRNARLGLLLASLQRLLLSGHALRLPAAEETARGQQSQAAGAKLGEEANVSNGAPTGSKTFTLYDALRVLVPRDTERPVCMAVSGNFMGRLSNTVSMMNVVLRHALNASTVLNATISYKYPQSFTSWMKSQSLDHLFGTEPVCPNQNIPVYQARCPPGSTKKTKDGAWRCDVQNMIIDTARATQQKSSLCGCGQAVLVPSQEMLWDHFFSSTRASLSEHYWQSQPEKVLLPGSRTLRVPGAFPWQVMMHVRLGDVENNCSARYTLFNCNKRLKAELYVKTMQALLQVLPAQCLELNILTDGKETSPDILQITGNLSSTGLRAPQVWTSARLDAGKTFHLMTHANVLIYGSSGYSQLAAVLAKPTTARLGPPMPLTQQADPFWYLSNTTQLRARQDDAINMTEAVQKVKKNEAIRAFARECQQRLGPAFG